MKNVVDQATKIGAKLLVIPWGDSVVDFLAKEYGNRAGAPHLHLLLGRCPPGILDYIQAKDRSVAVKRLSAARQLAELGACVGRLCAAFDPRAGQPVCSDTPTMRWIVDPIKCVSSNCKHHARQLLDLAPAKHYSLLIGDLSARKKVTEVVRAWSAIYDETGIELLMAGKVDQSVPDLPKLTQNVAYITTDYGYLSSRRFVDYIAAADVVLCTFEAGTYMSSGVAGIAAATGIRLVADGSYHDPVNIGSSERVTINQLISVVEEVAGIRLRRIYDLSAPQGVRGRNSNNDLILSLYGWEPSIPLIIGIERTYAWIYDQLLREYK